MEAMNDTINGGYVAGVHLSKWSIRSDRTLGVGGHEFEIAHAVHSFAITRGDIHTCNPFIIVKVENIKVFIRKPILSIESAMCKGDGHSSRCQIRHLDSIYVYTMADDHVCDLERLLTFGGNKFEVIKLIGSRPWASSSVGFPIVAEWQVGVNIEPYGV